MIRILLLVSLIIPTVLAQKHPSRQAAPATKWLTLSGKPPMVIARGGFSGLFPYGTEFAIDMAMSAGHTPGSVIMYCDVQFTKDGLGVCLPSLTIDNATTISDVLPDGVKTYKVKGKDVKGWFAVDYGIEELLDNATMVQSLMTRPSVFDGALTINPVEGVVNRKSVGFIWLDLENEAFYNERKVTVTSFVADAGIQAKVAYVSSSEISILKGMKVDKVKTKLIFRFLAAEEIEPSTKQPYSAILKDLASVKAFASGIMVPKDYIWPVGPDNYLQPPTTLVTDAHKLGLEVYAYKFANDAPASFNYSYDPTLEYLNFFDAPDFAVDGVLTDFPPTALESLDCFAKSKDVVRSPTAKALVISHNGASGIYPGGTDLAYEQAITDGADVIDCAVQMTKDGIAFCMDAADLTPTTTATLTFMPRSTSIPEIQTKNGIFSFDLTWSEIQTLKPQILSPYAYIGIPRDPGNKNKGKFLTLTEFLDLAKTKAARGILINIENAAYLASKKGFDLVGAVTSGLSNATLDKPSTMQVLIQSDDSSVLSQFKSVPTYKRLLTIKEKISQVPKSSADEVKKYADGVVVLRESVQPTANFFLVSNTRTLQDFHAANLSVHVSYVRNEYISLPFDYGSDPTVELATLIAADGADGIMTDFPATATKYLNSRCYDLNGPQVILPVQPGSLLSLIDESAAAPVPAPAPALQPTDVVDPPLPPVTANPTTTPPPVPTASSPSPGKSSSASTNAVPAGLSLMVALVLRLLFFVGY